VHSLQVMDALNRFRFGSNADLLGEWESASNVVNPRRTNGEKPAPEVPPSGGELGKVA
jgi:hypothetical protein